MQGYTHYGSVYASKTGPVTCGFISHTHLYMLPYYDLYKLKEDLEERYRVRCDKLKATTKDKYNYVIRKINA